MSDDSKKFPVENGDPAVVGTATRNEVRLTATVNSGRVSLKDENGTEGSGATVDAAVYDWVERQGTRLQSDGMVVIRVPAKAFIKVK